MKKQILSVLAVLALGGFISATPAFAQDKTPADQTQHDSHHPDATASSPTEPSGMNAKGAMTGKMDMEHMQGMMNECMQTKKDGKMCNQEMMKKCSGEMSKSDCKKMMKHAKSQNDASRK